MPVLKGGMEGKAEGQETLVELMELVKALEEKFGVSAAAPVFAATEPGENFAHLSPKLRQAREQLAVALQEAVSVKETAYKNARQDLEIELGESFTQMGVTVHESAGHVAKLNDEVSALTEQARSLTEWARSCSKLLDGPEAKGAG